MALDGSETLRITPETMLNISTQFAECNSEVQNLTRQMLDIASTLQGTWQSEAATRFYSVLAKLEPDMTKIHNMIDEHAEDLSQIARVFIDAENENAQTATSLPTGDLV